MVRNYQPVTPTAHLCAHCGAEFIAKRRDARYCSSGCRVAVSRLSASATPAGRGQHLVDSDVLADLLAGLEAYRARRVIAHKEAPGIREPGGWWYDQLRESISNIGVMTPLLRWRGQLVDGEMRQRICDEIDPGHPAIPYPFPRWTGALCACGLAYRDLPAATTPADVLLIQEGVHITAK